MAEVHIIGEIEKAKDFKKQHLFCKWYIQIGNNWRVISGKKEGQTQVAHSEFEDTCNWSYPIDIHLATSGIQGWPKLYLEVYHLDWLGRSHLYGYGVVTIPTLPGRHDLDCYTWRPAGTLRERFVQYFLGGGPQLKDPHTILSGSDRYKINTEAMGVVTLKVTTVFRNFFDYGVEYH
ncbi:B9 domain-containing protein 2-like [Coccinella septempunctata]|uniref:B9 domain-containing protein 2-like n=1 Tax=Coccinella septempunctata TaxID=41139 RepID=UPI001D0684B6|nr:B9 domain-containing protein 2-like [Coccinella septempunctata]